MAGDRGVWPREIFETVACNTAERLDGRLSASKWSILLCSSECGIHFHLIVCLHTCFVIPRWPYREACLLEKRGVVRKWLLVRLPRKAGKMLKESSLWKSLHYQVVVALVMGALASAYRWWQEVFIMAVTTGVNCFLLHRGRFFLMLNIGTGWRCLNQVKI